MFILLISFVVQVICISFIVLVLKKILDNLLIEFSLGKLESLNLADLKRSSKQIVVVTHNKGPKPLWKEKIKHLCEKKFGPQIQISYQSDKGILGGIIFKGDEWLIDGSLLLRLKQGGFIK